MLLSSLVIHRKKPQPRFLPALFLALLAVFALLGQTKPIFGLVGIGTTLIITATLVELNRQRIWDTYRKSYKKQKGFRGMWSAPSKIYYTINVVFLWPFVIFLGVLSLWAAYALS